MSPDTHKSRGMYFEEYQPGMKVVTSGRTVTEADIVNFAGISGDFTQIHTDVEYSRSTIVGRRVAHGLLGLAIFTGLIAQTGVLVGTVIAFREIKSWKFIKPTFIGDTIHGELEVLETKELRRIGAGSVDIMVSVKNQNDEVLMKGVLSLLIAPKPE